MLAYTRCHSEHYGRIDYDRYQTNHVGADAYMTNQAEAARLNARASNLPGKAVFSDTSLSDLCPEEFERWYLMNKVPLDQLPTPSKMAPRFSEEEVRSIIDGADDTVDWVTKGAVTG